MTTTLSAQSTFALLIPKDLKKLWVGYRQDRRGSRIYRRQSSVDMCGYSCRPN